MAYGIINMGQGIKQNAMSSFSELAKQEQQQNLAEDQMQRQQDAAKANTIGTTAGMGLQSDMSEGGGLTKEAWNKSFGGAESTAPTAIENPTAEIASLQQQNAQALEIGKDLEVASQNAQTLSDAYGNGTRANNILQGVEHTNRAINTASNAVNTGANVAETANAVNQAKTLADGTTALTTLGSGTTTAGAGIAAGTTASTAAATTTTAATTVGGVEAGAQAGASFGPWGALAGAAIGYLISSMF